MEHGLLQGPLFCRRERPRRRGWGDKVANKETGKAFETPKIDIWRFRDGRAIEFFEHYDTAQILDAAKP